MFLMLSLGSPPPIRYLSVLPDTFLVEGTSPAALATIKVQDRVLEQGYVYSVIQTNPEASNEEQAYGAGFVEGYALGDALADHMENVLIDTFNGSFPHQFRSYATKNLEYIHTKTRGDDLSDFWLGVKAACDWLRGLTDGYARYATENGLPLYDIEDFFMYNAVGDWEDLEAILVPEEAKMTRHTRIELGQHHHCSGAIRLTPALDDAYFSHDTWTSFGSGFNRVMKSLQLHLSFGTSKHQRISFSSMPGLFSSVDDFYVQEVSDSSYTKSSNMAVLETTFHTFNESLYGEFLTTEGTVVLTWMRAQVANLLSHTADEWPKHFNQEESFTYNNAWIILDYAALRDVVVATQPSSSASTLTMNPKDLYMTRQDYIQKEDIVLLYINEVVPGHTKAYDVTANLLRDGYFFSINTPMDEELFVISGYADKNDPYWSFNESARYKIFTRELPKVTTLQDFKLLMRYNDYLHDEASNLDPGQSIASRYDLRDPHLCGRTGSLFGATDSKVTDSFLASRLAFEVIIGPARGKDSALPLFNFSVFDNLPRRGVPDVLPNVWSVFLPTTLSSFSNPSGPTPIPESE
ncbi:Phospholipase B [Giardia muris]|uniref:Phospholipase B-like n=1 Tax=Giardia muris TaxID=5742 RepID=A0A4Z1STA9_GIAMU|nr:Phospholipase B [Giardia muris]|eukprot:TNJ28235.1 Phospholipase B [Giardia muris]